MAATDCVASRSGTICERLLEIAQVHPDLMAISSDDAALTFKELVERAVALAHVVQASVGHGDQPVAILGRRRMETPLAMLACLFAGVPFLVIDASYPRRRIRELWELANACALLHCQEDATQHPGDLFSDIATDRLIAIDGDWPARNVAPRPIPNDTAYVLFTSGTTGYPKAIKVGQAPLVHFVDWYAATFQVRTGSRFSMLSGLGHDPILRDVFVPLLTGGELHIPRQDTVWQPDMLMAWMSARRIQYVHMTPQLADLLSNARGVSAPLDDLVFAFCGGDVLRPGIAAKIAAFAPNAQLINFYGTSETPQAIAYQAITAGLDAPYPLGLPIDDVQIHITDDRQRILAAGERGEIVIETRFLAIGYASEAGPEGHSVFLAGLTSTNPEVRSYRTGDIGFKDEEGRVHFCGRGDDQVKIRGYRVDCREVAAALERHGLAHHAVVLPDLGEDGEVALIAYVEGPAMPTRSSVAEWLPAYMLPADIVHVDTMPLLPNGKIDRATLRRMGQENVPASAHEARSLLTDELLKVLNRRNASPRSSFSELGGDSLSYIKASLIIEDSLGFLPDNWENLSLENIEKLRGATPRSSRQFVKTLNLRRLQLPIILRAISMILIVLTHAGAPSLSASATLFVISGMSLSRFRLPGILSNLDASPVPGLILKYAIPAGLWQILRAIYNDSLWVPDIFLMGTMWQPAHGGHYTFWFLDILTACILMLTGMALLYGHLRKRLVAEPPTNILSFLCAAMIPAVALYLIQVRGGWWDGELGETSTGPFRWFWMFVLGALIQAASTRQQKWGVTGLFGLLLLVTGVVEHGDILAEIKIDFFPLSVALLIGVHYLHLPQILVRMTSVVASNSLYIYIVNYSVIAHVLPVLGVTDSAAVSLVASLAVGIGLGTAWEKLLAVVPRSGLWFKRRRSRAAHDKPPSPAVQKG